MISGEEIREEALKREKSAPKAMQGSFYYGFREGAKWMQHKCSNKISELTEQLDASHVFSEGVKEHIASKAWNWFVNHIDRFNGGLTLQDGIDLAKEYGNYIQKN